MDTVKCASCSCLLDTTDADRIAGRSYCRRCSPARAANIPGGGGTDLPAARRQFDDIVDLVSNRRLLRAFFAAAARAHSVALVLMFIPGIVLFFAGSLVGMVVGSWVAGFRVFLKGKLQTATPIPDLGQVASSLLPSGSAGPV